MELVDTHCHIQSVGALEGEEYTRALWEKAREKDPDEVISRAREAGVTRLICVGCTLEDSQLAVDFVKNRENCWASIGIHPHEASRYAPELVQRGVDRSSAPSPYSRYGSVRASLSPSAASNPERIETFQTFSSLAMAPKVVAIGECGLDYFYVNSDKKSQQQVLEFQIQLALEHDLPVIFHVREAFDDFWPIFERYYTKDKPIRGVLHSFTDSLANLEKALGYRLYIGVNGIATFTKKPEQQEMYRQIPLGSLLLETDAPFLTPVPYRGKICEPYHVRTTLEFLAGQRRQPVETIAEATTGNARNLFGI